MPLGSAVIQTNLNGANFAMDCLPGTVTDVNPTDNAGPGHSAAPAAAFDTIAGPLNVTCLDSLGRQISGAAANLPTAVTRELDPIGVRLSAYGPGDLHGRRALRPDRHAARACGWARTRSRRSGLTRRNAADHPGQAYPLHAG